MEHPYRSRMPIAAEPYTEQVVLMEGQGIWYFRPSIEIDLIKANLDKQVAPPRVFTRQDFGLNESAFIFFLPQSVFKIHPLFDNVLKDIMNRVSEAVLVVMGGHRPKWTNVYMKRLNESFGLEMSSRLVCVSRVSSEQFTALLMIADAILHPFPFDGSRTSADALYAGKPMVTLPTEYLRGRMGAAFLRTMNIPQLVARNVSEYVEISVKLATNSIFYRQINSLIMERLDLIWEDMEVPYTWTQFMSNVLNLPLYTWEEFLAQTRRNITEEVERSRKREENRRLFDIDWGHESWLLNKDRVSVLETSLPISDKANNVLPKPCIFNNWKCAHNIDYLNDGVVLNEGNIFYQSKHFFRQESELSSIPRSNFSDYFDSAMLYFNNKDYSNCFIQLQIVLEQSPLHIDAIFLMSKIRLSYY